MTHNTPRPPVPDGLRAARASTYTRITLPAERRASIKMIVSFLLGALWFVWADIRIYQAILDKDYLILAFDIASLLICIAYLSICLLMYLSRPFLMIYHDRVIRRGQFSFRPERLTFPRETITAVTVEDVTEDPESTQSDYEVFLILEDGTEVPLTTDFTDPTHAEFVRREIEEMLAVTQ